MKLANYPQSTVGLGLLNTLLVVGSLSLVAWGGVYLGHYSGRFDGLEFDPVATAKSSAAAPAGPPDSPEVKKGRKIFTELCAACHGAVGQGEGAPGVPPLDKSEWVTAAGPARLIRILGNALAGPLKVAGKDYNTTGMLAFRGDMGGPLSAEDTAAVLTFIRQAWSNKAGPVTTNQVEQVWKETKDRKMDQPWTAAELEKIPEAIGGAVQVAELTPDQLRDKLNALPPDKLKELLRELSK